MRARQIGRVLLHGMRAAQRAARQTQREAPSPAASPSGQGTRLGYAPVADDRADPGEVVWAWVP